MARVEIEHAVEVFQGGVLKPYAGATVQIQRRSDNSAVGWYETEDATGLPSTDDLVTDAMGRISAWIDPGSYKLVVNIPGQTYEHAFEAAQGGAALPPRTTSEHTTGTLGVNDTEDGLFPLARSYRLMRMETNYPARVRLYTSTVARDADRTRMLGVDPGVNSGTVLDAVTQPGLLRLDLTPQVDGSDLEEPYNGLIPYNIQNLDSQSRAITVTFVWMLTEATDALPEENPA